MMEESAVVESVADGKVWVVKEASAGCPGCTQTCDAGMAGVKSTARLVRLRLESELSLHPGDRVVLGFDGKKLVLLAVCVYLLPLVLFFFGVQAGMAWFGSDAAGVIGGLLSLGLCFVVFKLTSLFDRGGWQPVILRKIC